VVFDKKAELSPYVLEGRVPRGVFLGKREEGGLFERLAEDGDWCLVAVKGPSGHSNERARYSFSLVKRQRFERREFDSVKPGRRGNVSWLTPGGGSLRERG